MYLYADVKNKQCKHILFMWWTFFNKRVQQYSQVPLYQVPISNNDNQYIALLIMYNDN